MNVATGPYIKGQERLIKRISALGEKFVCFKGMPPGSPAHSEVPYAFKAYALKAAERAGAPSLLWADACIYPVKPLDELWERIERDGYWIGNGGWSNYEWTADSAYPDLFGVAHHPTPTDDLHILRSINRQVLLRSINRQVPHVVATTFGVSLAHPRGRAIFEEYYRLASETKAFCGPWINQNAGITCSVPSSPRVAPCGPPDVRGHRHDQTALSVIAWRLGCEFTNSPEIFAYGKLGDVLDSGTILLADGAY